MLPGAPPHLQVPDLGEVLLKPPVDFTHQIAVLHDDTPFLRLRLAQPLHQLQFAPPQQLLVGDFADVLLRTLYVPGQRLLCALLHYSGQWPKSASCGKSGRTRAQITTLMRYPLQALWCPWNYIPFFFRSTPILQFITRPAMFMVLERQSASRWASDGAWYGRLPCRCMPALCALPRFSAHYSCPAEGEEEKEEGGLQVCILRTKDDKVCSWWQHPPIPPHPISVPPSLLTPPYRLAPSTGH